MSSNAAAALEQIRRVELDAAQRVDEARTQATAALRSAQREAAQLVTAARERGRAEANRRYDAGIAAAQAEADRITQHGERQAAELRRGAEPYRARTERAMFDLLLAPPLEEGK